MQAGSVPCNQKFHCKWNLSFFKAVPPNRLPLYLGSLLHIIISLSRHFRSWDYPENFEIYSQLDRKSKTWFFTFLDPHFHLNRMGQNPNVTAFTSKIQLFCRPEWTDQSGTVWKWILTISKYKNEYHTNRAQKVDERMASFV